MAQDCYLFSFIANSQQFLWLDYLMWNLGMMVAWWILTEVLFWHMSGGTDETAENLSNEGPLPNDLKWACPKYEKSAAAVLTHLALSSCFALFLSVFVLVSWDPCSLCVVWPDGNHSSSDFPLSKSVASCFSCSVSQKFPIWCLNYVFASLYTCPWIQLAAKIL